MRLTELKGFVVYQLHENVFQRGHMERVSQEDLKEAFQKYNIRNVVGLARKEDPNLVALAKQDIICYDYYPIPDGKLKLDDADFLIDLAEDIAVDIMTNDVAVLCYCNAGRNRSGLMNALILRSFLDVSGATALRMVREGRPRAVANEHFQAFLESLK